MDFEKILKDINAAIASGKANYVVLVIDGLALGRVFEADIAATMGVGTGCWSMNICELFPVPESEPKIETQIFTVDPDVPDTMSVKFVAESLNITTVEAEEFWRSLDDYFLNLVK